MTKQEINAAREKMGLSVADLARQLRTPYRTVQDWCNGARPIPGVAQVAVELLVTKDLFVMESIKRKLAEAPL